MPFEQIQFDCSEGIARVAFNLPDSLNSLTRQMLAEFDAVLDQCSRPDSGIRCLLVTGQGRAFSAGMNLADPGGPKLDLPDGGHVLEAAMSPILLRMRELDVPIVTALNGLVVGVSVGIALMGDIILAARSAYILQPFANVGLIPDGALTYLMPRLVGKARAFELAYFGDRLPAEKALEWGLINAVHDDDALQDAAEGLAQKLAQGPTRLYGMTRRAIWQGYDNNFNDQLWVERNMQRTATRTQDSREAMRAFFQKRPPNFTGN
ncbi:MAG TPA: 2-(1,2-epoxy-1,2-dihydrophenyl)acetyl-CoA isomerase [Alphaproteobacteria bacterium]|nr:2-(1,2-epoxy-1,2-dihydrophenyl)acetyl-CoA isomerase [Alphaproteobacteria bacterium]HCO90159.1 2-(1,2-epoxy-1,2-dihydrophenyl)acetyl-CoA isomerase [Alphaproteobacteria bacterium]